MEGRPPIEKRRKSSRETTLSARESSASMATRLTDFATETDADDWPPARRAPPVTTLLDMPPEMLMEISQRLGDARALANAACSCRALRDAADDREAWSTALESALPGVRALLEASPPDWALEERKSATGKGSGAAAGGELEPKLELKHPKLLLAALASGREFPAQVFNRELDNEAEDFLLSCYDAKLSLERWRPSAGTDEGGEEEDDEEGEGGGKEEEDGGVAASAAGVLTRARAAVVAALAAAAAATSDPSSSPSTSFGECPRSPRLARRRRMRPDEDKAVAAATAAAAAASAASAAAAAAAAVVVVASSSRGPTSPATATPEQRRGRRKKSKKRASPPGLPLRGISPTYTARFLPMGRSLAVETGVGAGRVRAAPPPPPRSHEDGGNGGEAAPPAPSPPLPLALSPGDAVEVQWKATESHPYGSWLGCVVSVFSPEGSQVVTAAARATAEEATNDGGGGGGREGNRNAPASSSTAATVDILFQQYGVDSPWQTVCSVPLLPPGSNVDSPVNGDPAFGFVGGVRGPLTRAELERWEGAWESAEAAAVARGRSRPSRALQAGLPVAEAAPRGGVAAAAEGEGAPAPAPLPLVS